MWCGSVLTDVMLRKYRYQDAQVYIIQYILHSTYKHKTPPTVQNLHSGEVSLIIVDRTEENVSYYFFSSMIQLILPSQLPKYILKTPKQKKYSRMNQISLPLFTIFFFLISSPSLLLSDTSPSSDELLSDSELSSFAF